MGDILFLGHRLPYPPNRGDKIRGYHIVQYLSARARVHLVAFADDRRDLDPSAKPEAMAGSRSVVWRGKSQARAAIEALLSGKPVSQTAFDDAAIRAAVTDVLARHPIDTIYVFSSQMAQYLPRNPRQRVVMDFVDMDSAKFDAYADTARWPMRWLMRREARLLLRHDAAVARTAAASLFVSEAEAALFRTKTGLRHVHAIENGIDTRLFDPVASFVPADLPPHTIVFTGQMDYRPNIEAVLWFANEILPLIRARHPDAGFAIVGRAPTEAVVALADQPGVTVTGEVPDVRGWIAVAAVIVAPLKLARGVQNKVLEAMAMARPVVASVAAAEGIDHAGAIRVGADGPAIAAAVIALLDDRSAADRLGLAARAQVEARYSWEARLAPLDALMGLDLGPGRAPAKRPVAV
ncbi:TIGR03087 family PEP-CTERM/XrtA system glycosyltransferase [Sphingomonas sp. PAMC 26617]|uniref:TIGR03087 family PEP-CTERM/XrtA system glycosyltransferase n=1 Tax=Sphingomonas sp. PAMC 26617 TaxID=1112216 RepID=UPI000288E9CF|nr:TIGR03087 family PEP-CTERM/XrtA system glycosyltransferase [Sphingomonas sp. PAMC 26617]